MLGKEQSQKRKQHFKAKDMSRNFTQEEKQMAEAQSSKRAM